MKMSKVIAALLAATMIAGCGSASSSSSQGGTQGNGEVTKVSLTVWAPSNQIETGSLAEMEESFEKLHPEWDITWKNATMGEDVAKDEVLKDVEAAGNVFFFANDQLTDLVNAGAIAELGGGTREMVETTMAESVVDTAKIGDSLYGIPFTHNTFFMYYDKTLLNENDIKTLEGIVAKETPDSVYNFYFESSGGWKLGAYYYGAGCSVFGPKGDDVAAGVDWNNKTGLAVTNYLIDLINNKKVAFDGEITVSELISEHRLGAWFDSSWNYDAYKKVLGDDLGMAVIPTFKIDGQDKQLLSFYGSKVIGVNSHSKNMAAAVAFAAYLGGEEMQVKRYEDSGQIPTNIKAGDSEAVKNDPLAAVIVAEANTASVAQPQNAEFSKRYWSYAGAIPTEIRSGKITKANAQEKLDAFVKAMTAE